MFIAFSWLYGPPLEVVRLGRNAIMIYALPGNMLFRYLWEMLTWLFLWFLIDTRSYHYIMMWPRLLPHHCLVVKGHPGLAAACCPNRCVLSKERSFSQHDDLSFTLCVHVCQDLTPSISVTNTAARSGCCDPANTPGSCFYLCLVIGNKNYQSVSHGRLSENSLSPKEPIHKNWIVKQTESEGDLKDSDSIQTLTLFQYSFCWFIFWTLMNICTWNELDWLRVSMHPRVTQNKVFLNINLFRKP